MQVSSWHHLRRERPRLVENISDFPSFIHWKLDPERPYQYHVDTSIELQTDYLRDLEGNIVVDFIGRYENLAADYEEACQRIGIEPPPLPHKRQAKDRTAYRDYYNDEIAGLVADYFKSDIETLGYKI